MFCFKEKAVLITGAAGGIGSATVEMFYNNGAQIFASGKDPHKLAILKEKYPNITALPCDLRDKKACTKLIEQVGKLDILILNAGINIDKLAIQMSDEEFDAVIDINLRASFILAREAAKIMIKQNYGRIINISSLVAFTGNIGQINYCASKAALLAMTKTLALELAKKNITVNAVAPGFIISPMTDRLNDNQKEAFLNKIPAKRFGNPQDIASAIAFLASDNASYITGETLHVNGGLYMS